MACFDNHSLLQQQSSAAVLGVKANAAQGARKHDTTPSNVKDSFLLFLRIFYEPIVPERNLKIALEGMIGGYEFPLKDFCKCR